MYVNMHIHKESMMRFSMSFREENTEAPPHQPSPSRL